MFCLSERPQEGRARPACEPAFSALFRVLSCIYAFSRCFHKLLSFFTSFCVVLRAFALFYKLSRSFYKLSRNFHELYTCSRAVITRISMRLLAFSRLFCHFLGKLVHSICYYGTIVIFLFYYCVLYDYWRLWKMDNCLCISVFWRFNALKFVLTCLNSF